MGTILVVDDDVAVCKLVSAVLARDGLEVESVEGGGAALQRLAEHEFALVLTDMTMPGMSGLELIRAAEERGHGVPFLIMSAYLDPKVEQALCTDPGVAGVIRKPFEIAQLVADVRAVLEGQAAEAPDECVPVLALVPLEVFVLAAERLMPRAAFLRRAPIRQRAAQPPGQAAREGKQAAAGEAGSSTC